MSLINKLYQYFEYKGIKPSVFEKKHNFSNGYFSGTKSNNSGMNESNIKKVVAVCPDLNPLWWVFDEGKMLMKDQEEFSQNEVIQENLQLRKRVKTTEAAIDIFLERKGIFIGDVEELKRKLSNVQGRVENMEDIVLPDNPK